MKQAVRVACVAALLLTALLPNRLTAQTPDTMHASRAAPPGRADSSKHIKPTAALWRSFLIPGWGQACTGRTVAGAGFVIFEGVAVMMTVRAVQEEHYLVETGSADTTAKRQQIQDWVVLWGFNHLLAAAEAFVAAHLMDFPKELKLRAMPGGIGISVPLP